jgi:hypothetical protein
VLSGREAMASPPRTFPLYAVKFIGVTEGLVDGKKTALPEK